VRYARVPVTMAVAIAVASGTGTTQAYADAVPPGAANGWSSHEVSAGATVGFLALFAALGGLPAGVRTRGE